MTVRQEELKRSEFFRLPWVEEVRKSYLLLSSLGYKGLMFCYAGCCYPRRDTTIDERHAIGGSIVVYCKFQVLLLFLLVKVYFRIQS